MLDRVLVPVDGSLMSEIGVKVAAQIMPEGARLTILTVVPHLALLSYGLPDITAPVGEYEASVTAMVADANAYVKRLAQDPCLASYHVETAALVGDPAQCIIEFAQKMRTGVLIMTTHGRSGLSRWVFGSVTSKVLSAAPCPILVVPRSHMDKYTERELSETFVG